jgi:hypothetical protein
LLVLKQTSSKTVTTTKTGWKKATSLNSGIKPLKRDMSWDSYDCESSNSPYWICDILDTTTKQVLKHCIFMPGSNWKYRALVGNWKFKNYKTEKDIEWEKTKIKLEAETFFKMNLQFSNVRR